jgi:triosephosphate isomerase
MNPPPLGFDSADSPYQRRPGVDVVVLPTFLDLKRCIDADLVTGAQCGRSESKGAFTGDVSMTMLKELGCTYVLCGHSERRKVHHETDNEVAAQAKAALEAGLIPIVCIGETAEEREAGKAHSVVERQLKQIPADVTIIAYEPVWAIGTGKNATASQVQEMHAFIRARRKSARILYGGSLSEKNAAELLGQSDVDGGLVGGASLTPNVFARIIDAALRKK